MQDDSSGRSKFLAWGRAGLEVPPDWDPAVLEKDFFRLDQGPGPALEMKLGPVKSGFSPEKILKRLGKGFSPLRPDRPPQGWGPALAGLKSKGIATLPFTRAGEQGDLGCVLHDNKAEIAALVRFYSKEATAKTCAKVLSSIRFYAPDQPVPWAMFDFRTLTPPGFQLVKHLFQPGRFRLEFKKGRSELSFDRLGPANVILKNQSLAAWCGRNLLNSAPPPVQSGRDDTDEVLDWNFKIRPSAIGSGLQRLMRRPNHIRVRTARLKETNKIIALRLAEIKPAPQEDFEKIWKSIQTK